MATIRSSERPIHGAASHPRHRRIIEPPLAPEGRTRTQGQGGGGGGGGESKQDAAALEGALARW